MKALLLASAALLTSSMAHAESIKVICETSKNAKPAYVVTATYSSADRNTNSEVVIEVKGALRNGITIRKELFGQFVPPMEGPTLPGGEGWDLFGFGEDSRRPVKVGTIFFIRDSLEPEAAELELFGRPSIPKLTCRNL